jgi:hypothetical protein
MGMAPMGYCGNWFAPALGPTESQAKRRRVLGLLLLEVRSRPLDRGA